MARRKNEVILCRKQLKSLTNVMHGNGKKDAVVCVDGW